MTQRVELNDPVECEIHIGASQPTPPAELARTCSQCGNMTWIKTAACMWCGHDPLARPLRWLVAVAAVVLLLVNIPTHN